MRKHESEIIVRLRQINMMKSEERSHIGEMMKEMKIYVSAQKSLW